MEEESYSWVRRVKFSHTIYHRLDSSKLSSVVLPRLTSAPLTRQYSCDSSLKCRPGPIPARNVGCDKTVSHASEILQNPITNKQRSVSPLPQVEISQTFKEAQSNRKRFSTPLPQRIQYEKGSKKKDFHTSRAAEKSKSEKSRSRKESAWAKYFDHVGRISAVDSANEWTIDLSKLFLGLRFASGAHSRLYHGIYNDQPVAVKIIVRPNEDEDGTISARIEKQFNREVTLLSRIHHQNIVKLVGICRKPPVFCVITEYLSGGSLRAFLHKLDHQSLPLEKLITISLDIARGMEYVHSQGVVHRDLKPENILFDEDCHLKVADFGIACGEAICDSLADDPGTYRWMAPEMIKHKSYGRKVDVYSFGLLLWEMVAGAVPYENMTPIQAAFAVVNKNLRPVIPMDCPPSLRALIEQCWALHPEKRPDFWQIVKIFEQFESSFALTGTLTLTQSPTSVDHKRGLLRWIQRLAPVEINDAPVPKPKLI